MSKYFPLQEFLQNSDKTTVTLTFQEIERILHASLPHSASNHSAWWANDTTQHPHAKAWLEAGWQVESPTEAIRQHQVTFFKQTKERMRERTYGQEKSHKDNRKTNEQRRSYGAQINYPSPNDKSLQELKLKYHELCTAYHPDHLDEKDKASGQRVFCEVKDAWDNKNYSKLETIYTKYQKAKSGELRQERLRQEQLKQSYYQQESYSDFDDYIIDQEILYEENSHQSGSKNIFTALLVIIIAGVIFLNIIQGCPVKKESNRTPPPRIEYTLPKSEGSSITVASDILTKYFGISYEQRQSSNLFMKDSHEYRYNGNGTWTITKKGSINNTNKDYIDTNNKNEVENYLHGLGF
jgi:hypothetical protein